ncbi:hypothetical protein Pyn_23650 [Prunus yedoensis var. nudiflora]|uniref:Uncharacterized protein n=1 Tax=Prunus yedoensis var. nudiflora TaxID=2094558 RepID=A0A314UDC5_PRUYE|nr:hypothetical protein Pyn_23650 [Prunus yedoensis var. nudiflora]
MVRKFPSDNDSSQDQAWYSRTCRLKAYKGVPYDKIKRMVIPAALKSLRIRGTRGQLAYERKKQLNKLRVKAERNHDVFAV